MTNSPTPTPKPKHSGRARVYLPNKGAHDYSAAETYGTIVPLTSGPIKLTGVGYLYRTMLSHLLNSSPEDYILICGPTIANIVACSIFTQLHERVNLLIYKSHSGVDRYYERTISFHDFDVK